MSNPRISLFGLIFCLLISQSVHARQLQITIDSARGADATVDYAALLDHGPWDDRNYALTAADVALLPDSDARHQDAVPAYFRIELRRRWPQIFADENARYPRRALNQFLLEGKGYLIGGSYYRDITRLPNGRFEVYSAADIEEFERSVDWPKFLSGEVRLSTPNGAAESAIAINPTNPNLVIAGSNGPGGGQKMWRSSDGGATWIAGGLLPLNECCDPTVGWSSDGTIAYAASLDDGVPFYRSTDNGATWTLITELSSGSDKEYLHVDLHPSSPNLDNIYLCWHDGNVQKFARSTDLGLSFGSVLTIDGSNRGIGCDITSDSAGQVYFVYPSTNQTNIRIATSSDGGSSFGSATTVNSTQANFDFPLPSMESRNVFLYVSADTDLSNGPFKDSVYVSWSDTTAPDDDNIASNNHAVVRVAFKRAGSSTWNVTNPHPTADSMTVDRYQQWLRVDNQGRVHIIFYDTRHSTNRTGVDLYYSYSTDGAQTWQTPTRITAVTSPNITNGFEWGDYQGLDLLMDDVIAIYTDNRHETGGTGNSVDVYAAAGFSPNENNIFANGFE